MLCFDSEKMNWYYHVLARRPSLVLVSFAVYSVACIIIALMLNKLPDFSDPTLVNPNSHSQSKITRLQILNAINLFET